MNDKTVFFVAFQEQANLGVGYLASVLLREGFKTRIIDFRLGEEEILAQIDRHRPIVIGFSMIFQYHIHDFKNLINYLRKNGVDCHFSVGGHYPSLRYEELLDFIPALDTVVLFEGEYTFLELVKAINCGKKWDDIEGLAYERDGSPIVTGLRPLEKDLDKFPPPVRSPLKEFFLGEKYATILAGRGCYYDCSFCSIREFYSRPPGPVKRLRQPKMVVKEMELLHQQLGATVFMFQDDDFPVAGARGKEWVGSFCQELSNSSLSDKILWKINCRPDEIDKNTFEMMKNAGLFLVYLGIESGTDEGLRLMNKHMTAETSLKATAILKELGINYEFGFMLFEPSSSYESLLGNLDFLERLCGDGSSPTTFCKMLPYAETRIESELKEAGRLTGQPGLTDYEFLDESLNYLYSFTIDCFKEWVADHEGLLNTARWASSFLAVYQAQGQEEIQLSETARTIIAKSNLYFIDTVRALASVFRSSSIGEQDMKRLQAIKKDIDLKHLQYKSKLDAIIGEVKKLAALTPA